MDRREVGTGRIETFSDVVFAVAITLLVVQIGIPRLENMPLGATLSGRLTELWPSYLVYAISFLQMGVIWVNHHNRFRLIARPDNGLLLLNILFLMCVAFIPFPTAILSEFFEGTTTERTTAGVLYTGNLLLTIVLFTLLWLYAAGSRHLLNPNVDLTTIRAATRRYVVCTVLYILAFVLVFFSLTASLVFLVILALIFILPEASARAKRQPARSQRRIR